MRHRPSIKKAGILYSISIISFFLALHLSIPSYFNSSFLSTFTNDRTVSLIYFIISLFTIVGLLSMEKILHRFGNLRVSLGLIIAQMAIFYGLINSTSSNVIFSLFILGMSVVSLIGFTIDIFLQKNTDSGHTGGIRGLVMTAINMAWVLGPLIGGLLVSGENYRGVYIAGFVLLFPLLYLVFKNFNNFKDPNYKEISAVRTFMRVLKDRNINRIFIINIVLQTFYAFMVIYTPIYLHNVIQFNWTEISIIFTIMLIPFIIMELPLGKLADKKWGEREMMAFGFLIMGISTCALILFKNNDLFIWATMLFITRIGAATAEIMIETYFFKKVNVKDPEMLGLFRITRPLSYFVAPVIVTIGLFYTTSAHLFVIFGVICILTLYPILTIKDTN